jgi:copper chaperone CopZ
VRACRTGAGMAFISSACCTVPLLLAAVGIGVTGSAGGRALRYSPLVGLALMLGLIAREVRRAGGGRFSAAGLRRSRQIVVLSLATFGLTWLLLTAVITPMLGAALAGRSSSTSSLSSSIGAASSGTAALRQVRLRISGMYCTACIFAVQSRVGRVPGVRDASVWWGGANVTYDPAVTDPETIRRAATFYVYEAVIEGSAGG